MALVAQRGISIILPAYMDVVPTLLYLLGLPVPTEMDGKVRLEAFREEFVSLQPVQYQENNLLMHASRPSEAVYTMLETAKIQERLKDLGYID